MEPSSVMFKRSITIIAILLFFILTAWLFLQAMKPEALPIGSPLPELQYESASAIESIQSDHRPFIVIWFHEDCDHCVYQLKSIEKHISDFKRIQLYLLTSDDSFVKKRRERLYPRLSSEYTVHWGFMENSLFKKYFGSTARPALYFFNRDGKLVHKITGEMKMSGIMKIINEIKICP